MSAYLKYLGLHVYLTTTNKSYLGNDKHIKANAQALVALRHTFNKDQFSMISHCDSTFAVCNTLTSPKLQMTNIVTPRSRRYGDVMATYIRRAENPRAYAKPQYRK